MPNTESRVWVSAQYYLGHGPVHSAHSAGGEVEMGAGQSGKFLLKKSIM